MVINMPEKLCQMCNRRVWVDNEDDVTLSDPEIVAEIRFTEGETLPDGMDYNEV